MNFNSLRFFISLFAVVYVTIFLLCISVLKYNYIITFSALGVVVSISIFILGYYLLKKNALFTLTPRKVTKPETVDLSEQTIHSLTQRLNKLMEEERLFTNPELNLNDLAKRLDISRNTLSQYLNICLKTNYNDYINRLRVEEMKLLLLDSNKSYLTIQALAQEAGFQSKTTYNRLFKQFTGVTPSEFKRGITTPENILSA
ncbi:MAG: helix-turn-helix transcriptional regulator [Thermoclostridium sp.]|nr:helix-turn-helix transcriptional regulator [Thermoclostridium sp.]